MSFSEPHTLYPRNPYEQSELLAAEQASIAQILGENYSRDPEADSTYWLVRLAQLASWQNTLSKLVQAAGKAAQERLAARGIIT